MPDIQQVSQTDYIEAVTDAVIQTVMATGGRLFVLFTSQDMLRKTYDLITESEQLEEYALFAQGITPGSRMKLLKSFQSISTILYYLEQVVFGKALTCRVMHFQPSLLFDFHLHHRKNPYLKRKLQNYRHQGLNPFRNMRYQKR